MAVAAVLTVLNLLAYPLGLPWHPEKSRDLDFYSLTLGLGSLIMTRSDTSTAVAIGSRCERRNTSSESEACLRLHLGSKPRNAATAETTGYARAFRRAFDSPQRCRLR